MAIVLVCEESIPTYEEIGVNAISINHEACQKAPQVQPRFVVRPHLSAGLPTRECVDKEHQTVFIYVVV